MAKADKPGKQEGEERFLGNEVNVLFRMLPKNRIGLVLPRGRNPLFDVFSALQGVGTAVLHVAAKESRG